MKASDLPVPVIYYHSVGEKNPGWGRNFLTLETRYFEDQIKYFGRHFTVISMTELIDIREGLLRPVKNPIVITFDDGYLDNWIWAFPVLKKHNVKVTIFVSPEFVDTRSVVRPTLQDVEDARLSNKDIRQWGFLSWDEMRIMEQSGLADIQSHTMSHTKLFVSDILAGFHPGSDSFYTTCNHFKERKPFCISDPEFDRLLKPGYPLFEERSAVIAREVTVNSDFTDECIDLLKDYEFNSYEFSSAWSKVRPLYEYYKVQNRLITAVESEEAYLKRLDYEISHSKLTIERALNKKVDIIAWPHGDVSKEAVEKAFAAGYRAMTSGKLQSPEDDFRFIPARIGTGCYGNSRLLSILRTKFKVNRYKKRFPYSQIDKLYRKIKER
ncbi:MAG: polysaccharide deacetylase family protein [Bacteroidales bacterium]|nr:polysaccharide deacetylase family protein [Bacteroidales bacterium]